MVMKNRRKSRKNSCVNNVTINAVTNLIIINIYPPVNI